MFSLNRGLLDYLFSSDINNGVYPILGYQLYPVFLLVGLIIIIAASYLLGSVNTAIIVSKLVYKDDVRKHGSGNAGMTNMLRTYGKKAAGLTLFGDMMKTVISLFIAGVIFGFNYVGGVSTGDGFCYVAGLFVVIGHVFPIFYKFKGGKGVLATATMALILSPVPFLILFAIFALIVGITKYVSLGSVVVGIFYPIVLSSYFSLLFSKAEKSFPAYAAISTIIIAILIFWCHRENLKRINERTEHKLSFGKLREIEEDSAAYPEPDDEDDDEDE